MAVHRSWLPEATSLVRVRDSISIVPPPPYTAEEGDLVSISIDGLETLQNRLVRVPHTGATAPPLPR